VDALGVETAQKMINRVIGSLKNTQSFETDIPYYLPKIMGVLADAKDSVTNLDAFTDYLINMAKEDSPALKTADARVLLDSYYLTDAGKADKGAVERSAQDAERKLLEKATAEEARVNAEQETARKAAAAQIEEARKAEETQKEAERAQAEKDAERIKAETARAAAAKAAKERAAEAARKATRDAADRKAAPAPRKVEKPTGGKGADDDLDVDKALDILRKIDKQVPQSRLQRSSTRLLS
jgi:hypothetical protein